MGEDGEDERRLRACLARASLNAIGDRSGVPVRPVTDNSLCIYRIASHSRAHGGVSRSGQIIARDKSIQGIDIRRVPCIQQCWW